MFSLVPNDSPELARATLMLCDKLHLHIVQEELADILRDGRPVFCDPRKTVVRRIAGRMSQLRSSPQDLYCSADALARRAMELDWYSPRFFGCEQQFRQGAAYLLPVPLAAHSDFMESVALLCNARLSADRIPHCESLFVALIEAFLCRCAISVPGINRRFPEIIGTIFLVSPWDVASSLYDVIANAAEADDEKR